MKPFTLLASMMLLSLFAVSCDRDDGQTAGESVESAAKQTGEALDAAAEKTGEVLGKATDDAVTLAKDASADVKRATTQVVPGDAPAIYDVLEDATEAATRAGGFDEFVRCLTAADRARVGEDYAEKAWPDLDDMAAKVQEKWKLAQGRGLDIDTKAAFGDVAVTLEDNGNSATAWLDSETALSITLRKEADGWRIDAPDALGGEAMKNALIARFGDVLQDKPPLTGAAAAAQRKMAVVVLGVFHRDGVNEP